MAESTESPKLLAGLAAAGLACVSLVAVAMALILRQPPAAPAVTANPVINIQPAQPALAVNRPSVGEPVPAVPAGPAAPVPPRRADAQGGPAAGAALPAPDQKVFLRVRGDAAPTHPGGGPLPMPVRADAQGRVAGVYASRQAANAPLPPDRPYADSGASGARWDLEMLQPRSTQALQGFRAPQGFSFFTARLRVRNRSAQPQALDLGAFEVRDSGGAVYLANPELSGPLPGQMGPGQQAEAGISFLVSDASPLSALALRDEGAAVLVPLARR